LTTSVLIGILYYRASILSGMKMVQEADISLQL
jgi:hypothetical protein